MMKRLTALLLTLACLTAGPFALAEKAEPAIEPYGRKITVMGRQMNVTVLGKGEKALVLMPGQEEISSYYGFYNLLRLLEKKYRVVLIEPFGSGLSDVTDRPRTSANISEEYHEALQQLGIRRYTILAHSMSGIYALSYARMYPDEVEGFIGIDTSTPVMEGGLDVQSDPIPVDQLPDLPDVDPHVNEQFKLIGRKISNNASAVDEGRRAPANMREAEGIRFRRGLRALYLLASQSDSDMTDRIRTFKEMYDEMKAEKDVTPEMLAQMPHIDHDWTQQHLNLHEDPADAQVKMLEGSHTLYQVVYGQIAELIDAFMAETDK